MPDSELPGTERARVEQPRGGKGGAHSAPAPAAVERRSAALRSALRKWWPLLVAVPAGAVAGGGYALVATPQYQADAYVMVVADQGADNASATSFAQAYGRVVAQPEILASASAETGVPIRQLAQEVQAQTSPDAPMIQITGSATSARLAAKEANAVARSMVTFGGTTAKQTRVKLMAFAQAAAPAAASSPSRSLDVAVGGAAGLLLGSLALLVRPGAGAGAGGTRLAREGETVVAAGEPLDAAAAPVPEQQRETAGSGVGSGA
ncbi:Wzz/FepE/Etk N-terminal domain-containing protein [Streptacidiphilus jiangxiensis]|uniref:Capsular polysaccharide biosynthesis protein n=1 Tax=Streptacidiphilus jiangxiensis TaxID=235985 RepID=A0A1H7VQH9_STRJI|nr:Wzz/FepE/Etk N-terminal domain-containing protein [Streptacidiphilus jiangxiensis]SEM11521.1 Capsular polysaccharide biosynthesis protein [Streptacidiphilus jiangxiensis]